ncbi:MAG: sigma-70 family RNA polymerase sigma factor [Deltaproteobacteria bacterium]|nr:sigma-70 family RNA polymerase sigma factor [Deltaproteobacteria bacterium]
MQTTATQPLAPTSPARADAIPDLRLLADPDPSLAHASQCGTTKVRNLRKLSDRRRVFRQEALPHRGALFGAAIRLTKNPDDAEDLVQETLFKAFRAFDQFEDGTNCKAWLFRIQTNTFINKYRRRQKEQEITCGKEKDACTHFMVHPQSKRPTLDPENAIADRSFSDEVLHALKSIPADFRCVVMLSDVESRPYKEVAEILGIPVGTVMSRLFRGRRILQEQLFDFAILAGVLRRRPDDVELSLEAVRQRRARKD